MAKLEVQLPTGVAIVDVAAADLVSNGGDFLAVPGLTQALLATAPTSVTAPGNDSPVSVSSFVLASVVDNQPSSDLTDPDVVAVSTHLDILNGTKLTFVSVENE